MVSLCDANFVSKVLEHTTPFSILVNSGRFWIWDSQSMGVTT